MLETAGQVFILLLFAGVGYALCKFGITDADKADILSKLEIYFLLPATVFKSFSTYFNVKNLGENGMMLLISVFLLFLLGFAVKFSLVPLKIGSYDKNILNYSLLIANYGYMGYAMALALFGEKAQFEMILFCLPLSIYTYTEGYNLLLNRTGQKFSFKQILNPVIVFLFAGCVVGLLNIKIPAILMDFLDKSSACMAPVSMLITGMVISQFKLKEMFADFKIYIVVLLRLLIIPAFIYLILSRIKVLSIALIPAVLTYAMPCGCNTIVFPKMIGQDCKLGAATVLVSMLASIVTVPIFIMLLR